MTDPTSRPIHVRPFDPEGDTGLVVSSWVGSHRTSTRWLSREDHDRLLRYAVKRALNGYRFLVACEPEHEYHLYGWACVELDNQINSPLLHYVFVKSKFRRLGIARRLLGEAIGAYTFITVGATNKTTQIRYIPTAWTQDSEHLRNAGLLTGYRPDLFNPGGPK